MGRIQYMSCGALLVLLLCAGLPVAAAPDEGSLRLEPAEIDVGLFYDGADVEVGAEVARCDGAVLVLKEGAEELTFNRKGKEVGIWLNVAKVMISGVPKVYLLASSRDVSDLCPDSVQSRLGLGIGSLRDRIEITSEKSLIGTESDEFFRLKSESGTYNTSIPIQMTPVDGTRQKLSATLPIAATVPPGKYNVMLYCFRDGKVVQQAGGELSIRHVGLADFLASLAQENGATYGIVAILIAILVGILMGVVFHSRSGGGH